MENIFGQTSLEDFSYAKSSLYREITKNILQSSNIKLGESQKPYLRGYYTGAFDMFHYGHLLAIQNALNYCNQLVVAVSTDEVIRDYKHREPVIPFEQRLAIVSSIKGVSIAIPQYDLYNKMAPAEALGCDVIFSCDEYQRKTYEGKEMTAKQEAGVERWEKFEEEAKDVGIDIVYLPRTNDISSTNIKSKILQQEIAKIEDDNEPPLEPPIEPFQDAIHLIDNMSSLDDSSTIRPFQSVQDEVSILSFQTEPVILDNGLIQQ